MSTQYSHKGRHGSYKLVRDGKVIIATISGAVGTKLYQRYFEDFSRLAKSMDYSCWGYILVSHDYHASTPQAEEGLMNAYLEFFDIGCKVDAYCIDSAMAIAQLDAIRKRCQFPSPIQERLFDDLDQAKEFVENFLITEAS